MEPAILWLVRLGLDQGLFSLEQARAVRAKIGDGAELIDFAQALIDDGHVEDVAALEKVAGAALARSAEGAPAEDPFTPALRMKPRLAVASEPAATATIPAPAPSPPPPAAATAATPTSAPAGEFDFAGLSALGDEALAEVVRGLLVRCGEQGASDLHLSAGARPFVRRQRMIVPLADHILSADESLRLNTALLTSQQRAIFLERRDYDYALAIDAAHRYRVNLMFHKNGAAGSYRMVADRVPRLEELGIKNVDTVRKLLTYHNGLMLVTGPVGAGKTTTLAAMVDELNRQREDHIITVEDPVEVVQVSAGCNVTQRQVGEHTRSFASALKGALREDPDIIVIGELRDLETIEMAISASETGHLVIGTMHTSDASTTLNRLLDVFPPAQQTQIRASVAESLRGIVCQRLLPAREGGLVMACEILTSNPAVAALIRDGKTQGLRNVIETGVREGMCLMENSVFELYKQRKITAEVARQNITAKQLLAQIT